MLDRLMKLNDKNILITGVAKTGTSTMTGMLNCHPKIFILYETLLYKKPDYKYANRFIERYSDAVGLFDEDKNIKELYNKLRSFLCKKGYCFDFVGDKKPSMNKNIFNFFKDFKIIFMVRDVTTWAKKEHIINKYSLKTDCSKTIVDYIVFFLYSFFKSNVLHIRMEDIIYNRQRVMDSLEVFLDIEMNNYLDRFWKKIKRFDKNNPKSIQKWEKGHKSSTHRPKREDVVVSLKSHSFWDVVLPIFYKYYNNVDSVFSSVEINKDIDLLKGLSYKKIKIDELYMK